MKEQLQALLLLLTLNSKNTLLKIQYYMKTYKKILSSVIACSMLVGLTGCRDDWSKENTPPNSLPSATAAQLLASAEFRMYPHGYTLWFYDAPSWFKTSQMLGFTGSYTNSRLIGISQGSVGMMTNQQKYLAAMEHEMTIMPDEAKAEAAPFLEAIRVLTIYGGLFDADRTGDMPYTEGGRTAYDGPLKPNYDKLSDLYPLWNTELKNAVSVFKSAPASSAATTQDIIYGLDWSKWAKFASSLRVKLATRLIHRDLALAKSIVAEAVADGVITDAADDVMYAKGDSRLSNEAVGIDPGELAYGSGNNTISSWGGAPAAKVLDWQLKNRDPRVRFMYEKNNWHAKNVDWYLTNGYEAYIPPVVRERYEKNANGGFAKWKDEFGGNLWARYIGLPDDYDANSSKDPELFQLYNYGATKEAGGYQLELPGGNYSYRPYSVMSELMIRTNGDYNVPRIPGEQATSIDHQDDVPRTDMYLTAAEVNFYLAEFATYGGVSGLGSANQYFQTAVRQSVEAYDKMARVNNVPYYNKTYGYSPDDISIALQDGEIAALLAKPDFQLTGNKADDLEKIFLNMEIHFMYMPLEHFATARRSGIPKFGSNLVARTDYSSHTIRANIFERRANLGAISPTDLMKDILAEVYARQGFTPGIEVLKNGNLNSERLWQDVGAPQYGEGPNVGL